ncbi:hypothetical protein CV102_09430 [Natronococcus pandeyae]|uniref:DUF8152 domain-containing protein n=1 Tax=Natronococcus pandeyae TaxID=2055836 RepID=A0A8J8Q6V1_9EURY|nr:hypothetical protein [Natronococcus pandeyae]TYL38729.1 hypothetical protein CV102_09430 [Natronococcus pandeyae]
MTDSLDDRTDDSLETRLEALHDHLKATAELPIDPKTNRWLGEAEAVARDAARNDIDPATARERVGQVQRLLSEADEPDHEEAAAHLEAARELCEKVLSA